MKKRLFSIICIVVMVLCCACRPKEDETVHIGTEDGGGSGYGVSVQSALKFSDFYSITQNSTKENNRLLLGSPFYTLDGADTYVLSDGSKVTLTYDSKGVLKDTLFADISDGNNYDLFEKLMSLGIIHGGSADGNSASGSQAGGSQAGGSPADGSQTDGDPTLPMFSNKVYQKSQFDSLSLYLERTAVLSSFGSPGSFTGRTFKKDSYIIDCYPLTDGSVLLLDYGYDRKTLRCAAIRGKDGTVSTLLGQWTVQQKPADFIRNRIALNSITALKKGWTPQKVYEKVGEPEWYEGSKNDYRDAFLLTDGSTVYLVYEGAHAKLSSAYTVATDGKVNRVALR